MSSFGFFIDITALIVTFIFICIFRKKIAKLFLLIPLPNFLLYLISSIPFIIFEENINCLPTGCVLIPWTVPFLLVFVLVLGLAVKLIKPKRNIYPLLGFMIFGILWEVIMGGLKGQLGILPPPFYIFMIIYVGISYTYLVVVPLEILFKNNKASGSKYIGK